MRKNRAVAWLFSIVPATALAQEQSDAAAVFEAVWFFGVMIVAAIVLAALRIRDARAGLPDAERKARMQKRLPVAIGALVMAIVPLLMQ